MVRSTLTFRISLSGADIPGTQMLVAVPDDRGRAAISAHFETLKQRRPPRWRASLLQSSPNCHETRLAAAFGPIISGAISAA
ncbi:hypothetical protein D2V17_10370 [Aurantiacibacter xanthus]|uniref:Uncharacterized protein n=1 Tax=Aurantiacibacter xanthus TaxID=1784712 RepID=A0A3A1P7H5_9SPHN|nr:hypothetical protein D2V17_10370 [Aurantiacibacter xanthus]